MPSGRLPTKMTCGGVPAKLGCGLSVSKRIFWGSQSTPILLRKPLKSPLGSPSGGGPNMFCCCWPGGGFIGSLGDRLMSKIGMGSTVSSAGRPASTYFCTTSRCGVVMLLSCGTSSTSTSAGISAPGLRLRTSYCFLSSPITRQAGCWRRACKSKLPMIVASVRSTPSTFFFSWVTERSARTISYSGERPRSRKGMTSSWGPLTKARPMNSWSCCTRPASRLVTDCGLMP